MNKTAVVIICMLITLQSGAYPYIPAPKEYTPAFYRGIYLTHDSAKKRDRLEEFIKRSEESGINYQNTPYKTVYITSKRAKERAVSARIVSYIQSFQIKIKGSGLTYPEYIAAQIDAVHDADISGFILWNARQDYDVPFKVLRSYYRIKTN